MTDQSPTSPVAMSRIQVRLGDLGLAKENLRFHEPADDGVEVGPLVDGGA